MLDTCVCVLATVSLYSAVFLVITPFTSVADRDWGTTGQCTVTGITGRTAPGFLKIG
jgi:hypothetical protein